MYFFLILTIFFLQVVHITRKLVDFFLQQFVIFLQLTILNQQLLLLYLGQG